ncbi:tetratricopeptide repeat protein [Mucilaginibacter paludis]|uniref:Tetratricopeptide TPR_2 repeat-containing protein n=1 Tax=Mucilaginibacter paludis DSM 18603 TaxID=714943 RepID=H1Y2W4_9SPHI|nr:tetratricopeptide repeat protein [Mucilaginibacter paludis]EHQ28509.1 Tetratricopeptide TPR_2 repeat-containing protein [Mucilaginibacter paludis DSM 18603]
MSNTQVNTRIMEADKDFGQTGKFVKDNQKSLTFIVGTIVALVLLYFAYQKFYLAPRESEAADQMHVAQDYWAKKDWDKAIKGDGGYPGFEKIISEYSNTKAANLAYFYLGTAYLNKGEFGKAIDNLSNFRGDDSVISIEALGSTGDAYVELKDFDKAETYFKKASEKANNDFLTPFYLKKLALVYEAKKDYKSAADAFQKIKTDFPASAESQSADEYIARDQAKQ